ncbi:MAG: hypothetical protein PG981_000453 [Wolbachia endosymbiont of Ctenocephalides orientis wCori]|nr:MAG: hypothetical protein PG981_000453 [Wolbachia endosymbiont of Ctenocephalides orientis wCori]
MKTYKELNAELDALKRSVEDDKKKREERQARQKEQWEKFR